MRRKNFAGWLVLGLLPLFTYAWMNLSQHHVAAVAGPVDVDQVSAELARSMSYGFVDQPAEAANSNAIHAAQRVHALSVISRLNTFGKNTGL